MKQVTAGLYNFSGLMAGRVYLIDDGGDLTLIDAGLKLAPKRIVKQLEQAGYAVESIKRILITHAHPDHVGGLPRMKALTGAQVVTSALERPVVTGDEPIQRPPKESLSGLARLIWRPGEKVPGTPVDREVNDGDVLAEVLGGLQVMATPGHTPGHISFWQPERKILIGGDVLFRIPVMGLRLPPAAFTSDMAEAQRSVARIAELDAQIACFGHGSPLTKNTEATLRAFAGKVAAGG